MVKKIYDTATRNNLIARVEQHIHRHKCSEHIACRVMGIARTTYRGWKYQDKRVAQDKDNAMMRRFGLGLLYSFIAILVLMILNDNLL